MEETLNPQSKSNKGRILAILLFFVIAIIAFLWLRPGEEPDIIDVIEEPAPAEELTLSELIKSTQGELLGPGRTLEVLAKNLQTTDALFEFVKTDVYYSSYAGHLQSPDTVLKTRIANSADKSLLLKALFDEIGVESRIRSSSPLPDTPPFRASPKFSQPPSLTALMQKIGYDANDWIVEALEQSATIGTKIDAIQSETDRSIELIREKTSTPQSDDPIEDPRPREEIWAWLELADGTILDPLFPDQDRPADIFDYSSNLVEARVSLNIRDHNKRRQKVLQWSGPAMGHDARISFLPAVDTIARLEGSPDPSDIDVWLPFLNIGSEAVRGEPFTIEGASLQKLDDQMPFTVDQNGLTVPPPVNVNKLNITNLSLDDWPRVGLTVKAETLSRPNWVASHFSLMEDGIAQPVRIDSLYNDPSPVIVVADTSGSMAHDGKFQMIRSIGTGLIDHLNPEQGLAAVTFSSQVNVKRLLTPLDETNGSVDPSIWDSAIGGGMEYPDAIDRALNIVDVDLKAGAAARIVLITDGDLKDADAIYQKNRINRLVERLEKTKNIRLFIIGVGVQNSKQLNRLSTASRGSYFSIAPGSDPQTLYDWLGGALAGQIKLSYLSKDRIPGETAKLELGVAGSSENTLTDFIVPDMPPGAPSAVELEIVVGDVSVRRTLVELGNEQSPWRMIGDYQIYMAPGIYPSEILAERYLDNWLGAIAAQDDKPPSQDPDNMSFGHVALVNGHIGLTSAALGRESQPYFPAIYINKTAPGRYGDDIYQIQSLDVPRNGRWLSGPQSAETSMKAGLAVAAAEARMFPNAQSVNARLNDADSLKTIPVEEQNDIIHLSDIVQAVDEDGAWDLIIAESEPGMIWAINRISGNVYPMDLRYSMLAKGTNVAELARKFDEIDKLLESIGKGGSIGISAAGMPYSQPFGGLIGLLRTQNKMWCYATVMMGYVGNAIEDENALLNQSTEAAEAKARELCKMDFKPEEFGKAMMESLTKEWAKAWASDVIGAGIQHGVSASAGYGQSVYGSPYGWRGAVEDAWRGLPGSTASVGGGISDAIANGIVDAATNGLEPAPIPMTDGFHDAMANAAGFGESP